jgi:uncharacterized iron-regulated membrane protein
MTKAKAHKFIRKIHRYMGVFFGIQFLLWTIGGIYFSWTDIKKIRGEDIRKDEGPLVLPSKLISPESMVSLLRIEDSMLQMKSIQLVNVLNGTYYQMTFHTGERVKTRLADAVTGILRKPLTEAEAVQVAKSRLQQPEEPSAVHYITTTDGHHEYREKPLPAYAVQFSGNIQTTVYVSTELGTVQSFRNGAWRVFDFLWMLHTMDYSERDHMNNWVLRVFSVLGLLTLLSGFFLYVLSFRLKMKKRI